MFREGQALYLQLKLLTAAHEILVVPKHMSPLHLSFFPAKYDAQRFVGSAKEWIGSCKSHKSCCEGAARKHQLKLRVLDCISGDLRELFQNQPYFCLSYAWGLPTYRQGAGPLALRSLPKTMEDAMYKTARSGMQYLWIDRYCIDQTNEAEKHDTTSNMDVIYQGAALTIVAGAGSGPSHGLAGVR